MPDPDGETEPPVLLDGAASECSKTNLCASGGGGGAAGRIRINDKVVSVGSGNASPTPSINTSVAKW